jgi:hypothetical protein
MNGNITLNAFFSNFDIAPNQTSDNRPYPETLLSIMLTGTNQSGGGPNRVILRFRDRERLAANPVISGVDIIMDMPKHDYEMIKDLINHSILATKNPKQLTANYRTVGTQTWVNLSLR